MVGSKLALAAFLAGLLGLERRAFLQAMASRPIVAGTLMGLVFMRPVEGLMVGAALELFFLGAASLGAAIPDNELVATVIAATCASLLAEKSELPLHAVLAVSVFLGLPAAKLGRQTDRLCEILNGRLVLEAQQDANLETRARRNLYSFWLPYLIAAGACVLAAYVSVYLLPPVFKAIGVAGLGRALSLVWTVFLLVSSAAAIRSVHIAHSLLYAALAGVAIAISVVLGLLA